MFASYNRRMYSCRVYLFTDVDDPYPFARIDPSSTDKLKRRQVLQRSKDLFDANIKIDVFATNESALNFNYRNFYQHIMYKNENDLDEFIKSMSLSTLAERIRARDYQSRATVSNGQFIIMNEIDKNPEFKLYRFVQATPLPPKVRIDRISNLEIISCSRQVASLDNKSKTPVAPSDINYELTVLDRNAYFTNEEFGKLNGNNRGCKLKLIGFKPLSCMKYTYYLNPGYILYPNDKKCFQSSRVFTALYQQCLKNEVFMLCRLTMGRSSYKLVALIPDEELNSFYVNILPFADDIRPSVDVDHISSLISDEAADIMTSIIRQERTAFELGSLRNPTLVHFWTMLETIALNRPVSHDVDDKDAHIKVLSLNTDSELLAEKFKDILANKVSTISGRKRDHSQISEVIYSIDTEDT
ncbi:hypothetical protein GJ496_006772 [Pomphorhynchus laevis]|nr:hypothetical protein GJ496_006772 [Pomphorhynchus laevis]